MKLIPHPDHSSMYVLAAALEPQLTEEIHDRPTIRAVWTPMPQRSYVDLAAVFAFAAVTGVVTWFLTM